MRQNVWEDLKAITRQMLALSPSHGVAHRLQGLALRNRGDLLAALPLLRIGMENSPSDASWPIFEYGLACPEAEQYLEAEQNIRKAAALLPCFPWFHYRLALALKGLGKITEAQAACRVALRLEIWASKVFGVIAGLRRVRLKEASEPCACDATSVRI